MLEDHSKFKEQGKNIDSLNDVEQCDINPSSDADKNESEIWSAPIKVTEEKTQEEEFEDYFEDMFL